MDLMPGIVDLTIPNYKDIEVYGKVFITSYVGCAVTINFTIRGSLDSANYVTGAINVREEESNG